MTTFLVEKEGRYASPACFGERQAAEKHCFAAGHGFRRAVGDREYFGLQRLREN
jgi:hypothetical protein